VKSRQKELFDIWRSTSQKKRLKSAIDFLKPFYTNELLNDEDEKQFIAFIKKECEKIRQKWVEKQRRLELFRKFYGHWLEEEIIYEKKCPISRRSPTPNSRTRAAAARPHGGHGVARPARARLALGYYDLVPACGCGAARSSRGRALRPRGPTAGTA
ncbi:hypothetical protein ACJJTC_015395, partial [Scirpophaga incertulas]